MTPEEIWSVQDSFAKFAATSNRIGEDFYRRLFEIAPNLKKLFKTDISRQGMNFMTALSMVVKSLSNFDAILPIAQKLAREHVVFGVKPEHYALVGEALMDTLAAKLSPAEFDEDTRAAWVKAYNLLSGEMIEAAYDKAEIG